MARVWKDLTPYLATTLFRIARSQPPDQILHVRPREDHPVAIPVQHQNPPLAHRPPDPREVVVAFEMPPHGDGLQEEAGTREPRGGGKEAFADFEGGEEVAVGGVGAAGVGGGEPVGREEPEFDGCELGVDGAGDSGKGK